MVARYDSARGHLTIGPGALVLDAGVDYAVTRLSDTSMTGRWTDGSYTVTEVQRGDLTTWEHGHGFFCGRRLN